ncbi:HD-GYP domain-containing protein [Desulfoluna spongiiphila]|uniref:HD domain-containing protein n=1 Tax=Desulfoluna spongiiphila TaxID=419481 RepID=A0A1G5EJD3_9BACT|nr:HD domain-containing phosphohydrolase [Desulfoluna spongiiphila]SCY26528.1 HD domain-containing protein [Desulfoluna spongiiphila]
MGQTHSLHTFVHRTLVIRLVALGVGLSLLMGAGVLLVERDRVSREAIAVAVDRLALFSRLNEALLADPDQLDADALHHAALDFRATRSPIQSGAFAFIGIYDLKGARVIDFYDETHDSLSAVKAAQQSSSLLTPDRGSPRYEIVRIAGRPYLRSALPLSNSSGQTVGIINGFFAFSPETIKAFRMRGLRAMAGSMLIVLLTTAMVYPVILKLAKRITRFSVRLLEANLDTLETLGSAIAQRDSDTNAHNYRVTLYAARLGEELGLPARTMRTLIKGAFLHDVGKIGIPDEVLLKPGKLDDAEYEIMKTHVDHGCDIIERSTWLRDALEVIRSHHEKVTGKGYPMGLTGDGIPITARVFAIADVFDALTSKRPYKTAWSFDEAMEILEEGRGTHFDPQLLDTFGRIAKPLYDQFGGKEKIFRDELDEILTTYFHEGMDSLEY